LKLTSPICGISKKFTMEYILGKLGKDNYMSYSILAKKLTEVSWFDG
jgi:hypothetical protein